MPLTNERGMITRDVLLAHVRIGRKEGRWQTIDSKIPGLILGSDDLDGLVAKIQKCAGDLAQENCPDVSYDGLLIDLVLEFEPSH